MLKQSKKVEIEQAKSSITTLKPEQVAELSKDLDKIVAKLTKELELRLCLPNPQSSSEEMNIQKIC